MTEYPQTETIPESVDGSTPLPDCCAPGRAAFLANPVAVREDLK
jgi:hypothetical protein